MTTWRLTDLDWNSRPDGLSDADFWQQTVDLQLDGIELGVHDAAVQLSPARLAALPTSLPVTDIVLALPAAGWPDGALSGDIEGVVAQVEACAEVCRQRGLPVLGLSPGADQVGAELVAGTRRVVEAAGDVRIALEYQPGTAVGSALDALWLCDQVKGLGVLLDTGHALAGGEDPAVVVEQLGDLLLHCHLSDAALGGVDDDLPCGRVHDFTGLVTALDAFGWRGTASFDLYGAVAAGSLTGRDAVRESRDHILSRRV